jgi:hypothetical protein
MSKLRVPSANSESFRKQTPKDVIVILSEAKDLWHYSQLSHYDQRCFAPLNMTTWAGSVA